MFLYNLFCIFGIIIILTTPMYVLLTTCPELSMKEKFWYSVVSFLQVVLFFYAVYKIQGYDYFYTHLLRGFEKDALLFEYFRTLYITDYAKFCVKFIRHYQDFVRYLFVDKGIIFLCLFIWVFVCVDKIPEIIKEYIPKRWKLVSLFFLLTIMTLIGCILILAMLTRGPLSSI